MACAVPVDEGHTRGLDGFDAVPAGNAVTAANQKDLSAARAQDAGSLGTVLRNGGSNADQLDRGSHRRRPAGNGRSRAPPRRIDRIRARRRRRGEGERIASAHPQIRRLRQAPPQALDVGSQLRCGGGRLLSSTPGRNDRRRQREPCNVPAGCRGGSGQPRRCQSPSAGNEGDASRRHRHLARATRLPYFPDRYGFGNGTDRRPVW